MVIESGNASMRRRIDWHNGSELKLARKRKRVGALSRLRCGAKRDTVGELGV